MSKNTRRPTHEIFRLVLPLARNASLARTLAECLYWMQFATRRIDGQLTIWKSGVELSGILGISARTASQHLKKLAALGFWELRYLPRPGHPSPVTWLVFSEKALEVLHFGTLEGPKAGDPVVTDIDIQTSQKLSTKQKVQEPPSSLQDKKFFPSDDLPAEGTNEISLKGSKVAEKRKAPKYLKVTPEIEQFVTDFEFALSERDLPEWDTLSKYTWQHANVVYAKLVRDGYGTDQRLQFIAELLDRWDNARKSMDYRYSSHDLNYRRPTPLALAKQYEPLREYLHPKPKPELKGGFNFDFGLK